MSRPIGSGKQPVYVSFRTSNARYENMIRIGEAKGFKTQTKSKVYRAAEELFIVNNIGLVEDDLSKPKKKKRKRPIE